MPRRSSRPDGRQEAPENCYWRGSTLWGRLIIAGVEHRWSLRTGDVRAARRLVEARKDELIAEAHHGIVRVNWDTAFVAWTAEGLHDLGILPATAERYAVSIGQLEPWLRPPDVAGKPVPVMIDAIDKKTVDAIVAGRRAAKVTTATIKRDLTALSSVLSFAEIKGWREGNPALDRSRQMKERRDPIVLPSDRDIERVIARAPGNLAHLIRTAWKTGCRLDELATAERNRIDHRRRQITVIGKRGKLRVFDLDDEAYAAVTAVAPHPRTRLIFWHGHGEAYANLSARFGELCRSILAKEAKDDAMAQAMAQRGSTADERFRRFRFHDLRHAFAVAYLKKGGSIYTLQGVLGHTSVKTTEIYLAYLTPEEQLRAKYGPGAMAQNMAQL